MSKIIIKNNKIRRFLLYILDLPLAIFAILIISLNLIVYYMCTLIRRQNKQKPRLLFGTTPIVSIKYIADSLKQHNYQADVLVIGESPIYPNDYFDFVFAPKSKFKILNLWLKNLQAYYFFLKACWSYDIFHYYFDGGILRYTVFKNLEFFFLKLINKLIILIPYGSDAFVYDLIPNPIWRHGLMQEYALLGNDASYLQKKLRRFTSQADIVIGCLVHFINLPRWDILPLTCYPIDIEKFKPVYYQPKFNKPIKIAHATNHRGIKGTIFLIHAVEKLKKEGFNINFDIIEKTKNPEALRRIANCDIYVDQLFFGYAQAALEAMAFGKVVISALSNNLEYEVFRRFSYLKECPIISADTETIYDVLRELLNTPEKIAKLGKKCRNFVENRHSFTSCAKMYETIYAKIWWEQDIDLINFYNPLVEQNNENSSSSS